MVGAGIVMANLAQTPTVTTGAASAITSTSATLGGTVNPNGLSTTYIFLYGTSYTAYTIVAVTMTSPVNGLTFWPPTSRGWG